MTDPETEMTKTLPVRKIYHKSQYPTFAFYCDQHTWKRAGVLAEGDRSRSKILAQALRDYNERRAKELLDRLVKNRRLGWKKEVEVLESQLRRAGIPLPPPEERAPPVRPTQVVQLPRGYMNMNMNNMRL